MRGRERTEASIPLQASNGKPMPLGRAGKPLESINGQSKADTLTHAYRSILATIAHGIGILSGSTKDNEKEEGKRKAIYRSVVEKQHKKLF